MSKGDPIPLSEDDHTVRAVQGIDYHRKRATQKPAQHADKAPPAEKAIHIPLPFDDVMSAVLKVKPQPKTLANRQSKKSSAKK
jgi:hypothetical protein